MARSGGFNVPADYFKTPAPSAIVPATPPQPQAKWSRLVWVAGAAAAVVIVTLIFVMSSIVNSGQQPKPVVTEAATVAAPPPSAAPTPPPAVSTAQVAAPPPVKKVTVALAAVPLSAMGYVGDKEIPLPATIDVEEGKTVTVELRADGYESAKVDLDGKELRKQIELKKKKPGAGAGSGDGKSGNGETVDPWANPKRPRGGHR
jgi:serine/threonine-protein kinase